MEHWWVSNPDAFAAWYGGIVGGGGGALVGLLGGLAGTFAPRGKGRTWIEGGFRLATAVGVLNLIFAVAALAMGQPGGIWQPALFVGLIIGGVSGGLLPTVRKRYDEAERRRLDAETLRGQ